MLSAGAVVGGVITNHAVVAGVVSSMHHVWQAIHERQVLVAMHADDMTQNIYIVRCQRVGQTAEGTAILRYVVETNGENDREGFTDMDELRRSLLEQLNATATSTTTG